MPLPYIRLLAAQVAISAAAIFARFALASAGPLAVSALRLILAAAVAVAIVGRLQRVSPRREAAFALAGLALALHFAAWLASLQYTSVAVSTLLVTTTPLWTELYDALKQRRRPSLAYALALGCATAGAWLVVAQRNAFRVPIPGHALLGDALALSGSVAIGAYLLLVRDAGVTPRAGGAAPGARSARLGTRQIVVRTYGWAAVLLLVAATLAAQRPPPLADGRAWGGILGMAFVSQLLGHTGLNAALRDFSPTIVAFSTLLEPALAALFAAAIFRETLSGTTIAGGLLVLAAVAGTLRQAQRCPA